MTMIVQDPNDIGGRKRSTDYDPLNELKVPEISLDDDVPNCESTSVFMH